MAFLKKIGQTFLHKGLLLEKEANYGRKESTLTRQQETRSISQTKPKFSFFPPHAESEICVPTLETECEEKTVELKAPVEMERCLTIPMISCKAEVRRRGKENRTCLSLYKCGNMRPFSVLNLEIFCSVWLYVRTLFNTSWDIGVLFVTCSHSNAFLIY